MKGFLMTLLIAVLTGWLGEVLVKENMPAGFWGALLAALVGAWIGGYIPVFNMIKPIIDDVAVIPAILGAGAFVFMLGLSKAAAKQLR